MEFLKRLWADDRGEDVAEYALVMGLVALAAIVGLGLAGDALNTWWTNLGTYIGTIGP